LVYLGEAINHVRWDESIHFPLVKFFLLFWKATLVLMGGLAEISKIKESLNEKLPDKPTTSKPFITASPLDYHTFRQEITSKYPAYVPPPSTFPLEPDQKSVLPPLRNNTSRTTSGVFQSQTSQHGSSILHQPVHIATPAPSPPPSPAVGKGAKKQNYQTNQLFPFMYPPLDAHSNQLGGKGSTYMQDNPVGRKWTGTDIPSSILEASELFSSRIRKTRALKQLWEERVAFLKHERGWVNADDKDVAPLNLSEDWEVPDSDSFEEALKEDKNEAPNEQEAEQEAKERIYDGSPKDRLQLVEDFYVSSMFTNVEFQKLKVFSARESPPPAINHHDDTPHYPDYAVHSIGAAKLDERPRGWV
jgi:hypothetical protein